MMMNSFKQHRFHVLDGMRGIAAINVMIFHYYSSFLLRCLKNGFLAVDFFFVLSGFVIFHAYGDKILGGFPTREYLVRRIARLYPMMTIGMLIGLPAFYTHHVKASGNADKGDVVLSAIHNFLMLPYLFGKPEAGKEATSMVLVFPEDGPLWSIFFEMVASVVFLTLIRLRENHLRRFCLGWFGLLVITAWIYGVTQHVRIYDMNAGSSTDTFLGGFPRLFYSFSAGMLIYLWRFTNTPRLLTAMQQPINPWFIYVGLVVMLAFPSYMQGVYDLFAVAVLAPMLVWFGSFSVCRDSITRRLSEFLGWLSFPVYCLHMPVFETLQLLDGKWEFSGLLGISTQVASIATTLLLAIAVGMLIDSCGIQRRLTNLLLGR